MEARRKARYEDLFGLPDHVIGEIVSGELHVSPRPAPQHVHAASVLGARLNARWQLGEGGPGGWRILFEPELHLGGDVVVPDVAGWRLERLPELPKTAWFAVAPDWVCEVLSPATARFDRGAKMRVYRTAGVRWLWLVDPSARLVEVYRRGDEGWVQRQVATDDAEAALEPFAAVPFDVRSLWG